MPKLEAEKLAEQIKLNQNKGLYLVENLSPNFTQAVADRVGVVAEVKVDDGKLCVQTYTSHEIDLDDTIMSGILAIFDELGLESEHIAKGGEDIYLLGLERGYELTLDADSYLQQRVPILADPDLLGQNKRGAKQ